MFPFKSPLLVCTKHGGQFEYGYDYVHRSVWKDWTMRTSTTGPSKIHRRAFLNAAFHTRVLSNSPASILPEPQKQPAAFVVSRQNQRKGNEREQLLGQSKQPSCSSDHVWVSDRGQNDPQLGSIMPSLILTVKAIISWTQHILLPDSSLYKWLGEQEEATRESQGWTESLRTMAARKGLQGERTPQGKPEAEHVAVR